MSLINDALKKAQRQRNDTTVEPPMPGGGRRGRKSGAPMSAQTVTLVVAACVLIAVLSGVAAVFFFNGKSEPKPLAIAAATPGVTSATPTSTPSATSATPKIEFSVPVVTPAPKTAARPETVGSSPATPGERKIEPKSSGATSPASTATVATPTVIAAPVEATAATTVAPAPVTPTPTTPDERIYAFIDAIRLTGVRSSGNDSRVLMNEHVYRVNDFVDRSLGLKLKVVAADHLTFVDASGNEYVKNF